MGAAHMTGTVTDWNPVKRPYCRDCPHYECIGRYVYELERDPKMRDCQHLSRCKWVHDKAIKGTQIRMEV